MEPLLAADDPDQQAILREWLKPQPAYYATVARSVDPNGPVDPNWPVKTKQPATPKPTPDLGIWTAVSTGGVSAHVIAWTEEMPIVPDNSETDYLAYGLKLVARTPAWTPPNAR